MKNLKKGLWAVVALFIVMFVAINVASVVKPGYRAARETCGYVDDKSFENGLVFHWPFVSKLVYFNVREQKYEFSVPLKLNSLQNVQVKGALNYQLNGDRVHRLYLAVGEEDRCRPVLIDPLIEGSLSQIVGGVTPEYLVFYQDQVQEAVSYIIVDQFAQTGLIEVRDLRLFKPKFDDAFENAISDKAVASQLAEKAAIETQRVEEEAKQMMLRAQAEGKALKLKSEALQNPLIVQYEVAKALGKWKGNLPSTLMLGQGGVPLVSVK